MTEGETILWHRDSTHGIIHKEVTSEDAVTNKRCLKYDVPNKRVIAQVGIENIPEVVIMNVHKVNDSLGGGIFLTPRMLGLPGLPLGLWRVKTRKSEDFRRRFPDGERKHGNDIRERERPSRLETVNSGIRTNPCWTNGKKVGSPENGMPVSKIRRTTQGTGHCMSQ